MRQIFQVTFKGSFVFVVLFLFSCGTRDYPEVPDETGEEQPIDEPSQPIPESENKKEQEVEEDEPPVVTLDPVTTSKNSRPGAIDLEESGWLDDVLEWGEVAVVGAAETSVGALESLGSIAGSVANYFDFPTIDELSDTPETSTREALGYALIGSGVLGIMLWDSQNRRFLFGKAKGSAPVDPDGLRPNEPLSEKKPLLRRSFNGFVRGAILGGVCFALLSEDHQAMNASLITATAAPLALGALLKKAFGGNWGKIKDTLKNFAFNAAPEFSNRLNNNKYVQNAKFLGNTRSGQTVFSIGKGLLIITAGAAFGYQVFLVTYDHLIDSYLEKQKIFQ